jgi:hypothetical protein
VAFIGHGVAFAAARTSVTMAIIVGLLILFNAVHLCQKIGYVHALQCTVQ